MYPLFTLAISYTQGFMDNMRDGSTQTKLKLKSRKGKKVSE